MLVEFWLSLAALAASIGLAVVVEKRKPLRFDLVAFTLSLVLVAAAIIATITTFAGSFASISCHNRLDGYNAEGDWGWTTDCRVQVGDQLVEIHRVRFNGGTIELIE